MTDPTAGLFEKMPARVKLANGNIGDESDSGSEATDVDVVVEKVVAESRGEVETPDRNTSEAESEPVVAEEARTEASCAAPACEEDNLHGLSIASHSDAVTLQSEETDNGVAKEGVDIELNFEKMNLKYDRPNPFNNSTHQSAASSPASVPGNAAALNLVSLDSFGNDEIAGSFIPAGNIGFVSISRSPPIAVKKVAKSKQTPDLNHDAQQNASHNIGLQEYPVSTSPTENTDPWVKIDDDAEAMVVPPPPPVELCTEKPPIDITESSTVQTHEHTKDVPNDRTPTPEIAVPLDPLVIDVPGPCEPEDLIEGIIFSANYLGTTQLTSNRNPAKNARMFQAQEAVNRIKAPEGESQPTVEVDLFISTSKIKIMNADTQETMMGHTLRSISYIADVGDLLVIMAKRHAPNEPLPEDEQGMVGKDQPKRQRIICHVLSSSDSHLIAESIGQCFNVAYQQFLQSNCIEPQSLTQADFNNILDTQEMYHDDLVHYSKQENVKEIWIEKKKGESMGIAIVESGWGSIIPTVILANLQHGSPMERNGKFSIGDQIMSINNTSLVGLPLQTCHSIIKGLRNQTLVKVNIVSCPPVVSVLIKRPDLKHQLGFSVQNGIICSLMRGGIAERGGVRVGHRIIEINNQSVVATQHDKIVQMLVTSVGEIQMKTMPAAMYRLLTGQEQPIYL